MLGNRLTIYCGRNYTAYILLCMLYYYVYYLLRFYKVTVLFG